MEHFLIGEKVKDCASSCQVLNSYITSFWNNFKSIPIHPNFTLVFSIYMLWQIILMVMMKMIIMMMIWFLFFLSLFLCSFFLKYLISSLHFLNLKLDFSLILSILRPGSMSCVDIILDNVVLLSVCWQWTCLFTLVYIIWVTWWDPIEEKY